MNPVILDVVDPAECLLIEKLGGKWTVRFRNLITGATMPEMTFAGDDKPALFVGGKYVLSVKATLAGN